MPVFLAALLGGLVTATSSIVGRVLVSLGIGYVTYSGLSVLLDWLKSAIFGELMGVDGVVLGIISVLQIDAAVNVLFSALAVRWVLQGIAGGSITKMVIK